MSRNSIKISSDFYSAIKLLPDDSLGRVMRRVMENFFEGEHPERGSSEAFPKRANRETPEGSIEKAVSNVLTLFIEKAEEDERVWEG